MPANPIAVDVVVLPTAPIGVTIADTTIVVDATVNLGNAVAVDVSEYASGPPGAGVPPGGTTGQYLLKQSGSDYDTVWTTAGGGPPTGAAGGDLTGSTYPNPVVKALAITRAKTAADCWLSPIPVGGDVGKVLTVAAGPTLTWGAGGGGSPTGAAGGDLTGTYPNPDIAQSAVRGTPSSGGTAREIAKLSIWGNEDLIDVSVGNAKLIDLAATKLTGTIAQARFPIAPSGLLTNNLNDGQITDIKIADVAWGKITGAPTSFPPTGAATGDLTGSSYPAPVISKINGAAVGTTTPLARGDLLVANATPALARLAKGATNTVLTSNATDAVWASITQAMLPVAPSGLLTTNINDAQVTRVKCATDLWLAPVPTGADNGKVLTVINATPTLGWATPGTGGPPSGAAGGDLTGSSYPNPVLSAINGAAVGTTTPLARGDILVANATPALIRLAKGATNTVLLATATDAAWGAITQAMLPVSPSGLLAANVNDGVLTRIKHNADCWLSPIPNAGGADLNKVLTVAAGPTLTWATPSATITMNGNAVPTGTRPGTVFTLPITPTMMIASLNGLVLQKVGSPAANDEYSQSGTTMTTFYTVTSTDKLVVWLWA